MYFDFKETIWGRIELPDHLGEDILKEIKAGRITSANDVFSALPGHSLDFDYLQGTNRQMTLEENGNDRTIEVWETDTFNKLFCNGPL